MKIIKYFYVYLRLFSIDIDLKIIEKFQFTKKKFSNILSHMTVLSLLFILAHKHSYSIFVKSFRKSLIHMSTMQFKMNFTRDVFSFHGEPFYDFVEQQYGSLVREIVQVQDISSVECLLAVGDIFTFVQLDSEELIPLKKKAGLFLNDGRFTLKERLVYKVENFLKTLRTLNQEYLTSSDHHDSNNSSNLIVSEYLLRKERVSLKCSIGLCRFFAFFDICLV